VLEVAVETAVALDQRFADLPDLFGDVVTDVFVVHGEPADRFKPLLGHRIQTRTTSWANLSLLTRLFCRDPLVTALGSPHQDSIMRPPRQTSGTRGNDMQKKTSRLTCVGIGLAGIMFVAGLWLGAVEKTSAQAPIPSGQNTRYLLTAASEGSMFMIDTWTGDTWALVPGKLLGAKEWARLGNRDMAGPRGRTD
jgi:hypothetical protein